MLSPVGLVVLLLAAQVPKAPAPPKMSSDELRTRRTEIETRETNALNALATTRGEPVASRVKSLLDRPKVPADTTRFVPPPDVIAKATPETSKELIAIRSESASALFDLAISALRIEPPRLAFADGCLRDVVEREPDHAAARRLLGYVPHNGGWATPFAAKKLSDGFVRHPVFGWVESDWVPHLERGELPAPFVPAVPTRWLPMAEADALRTEFAKGWQIKTEHFAILTNVPLSEAITFGRRLEALYDLFQSLMADLIGPESHPMVQRHRNPKLAPSLPTKTHRVFYFADNAQYVDYLLPVQGQGVRDNLGTYLPGKSKEGRALGGIGTSYFFRDPGGQLDVTETLYHEVSHQLLFEVAGPDKYEANRSHFWVFEGLGTYFETLRPQPDGSLQIGGQVGKRMESAYERLIKNAEFIPIQRITTMNKPLFDGRNGGDIFLHYAEAMALTVFFMQAENGKYREAFLDYARDVYKGRIRAGVGRTLDERLGSKFELLDREARTFLKRAKPETSP